MPDSTCPATRSLPFEDDGLHCTLPSDHTTPTDDLPQGTPHEDDNHLDVLDGEPLRWWS